MKRWQRFVVILHWLVLMVLVSGCSLDDLLAFDPYAGLETPTTVSTPIEASTPVPSPTPFDTPSPTCVVSTGVPVGLLNLRSGAGTNNSVIVVLSEGETLYPTGRSDGVWIEVVRRSEGQAGWINGEYTQCK